MKLKQPKVRAYEQTARAQSAQETGERIAGVFKDLLMQMWFDEVTLDRVAADANTTVQTIVRRFGGKDGLLEAAARLLGVEVNARREKPSGDLHRIFVNLVRDYEASGDAVVRLLALEERHSSLKTVLAYGRAQHRQWVADCFAGPLAALPASRQQAMLDALVVATDVYAWKLLRRDMGRNVEETVATMQRIAGGLLAGNEPAFNGGRRV